MSRLQEYYRNNVVKNLMATGAYKNVMDVPRITKITINMGLGEAIGDKKILENALGDMEKITGQKPVTTLARKSVASFKVRDGYPIGCKVTLRREQMYEFLDRLISISIPRERDFRGLNPKSFDGRGNFNMGIKEQIIFPEIEYEKIDVIRGMDVCITTTARDNESGLALLKEFNFPFKNINKQGSK
ncbi:LSU ribosomal protein L5p (L11e) [hydrothermal vent metagenome]|uniref:LSU ribosomal protein L5p (L11e) n=1 Tax=hydrothermal vent metagenome TaxID=652676 RepID=A0A3B0WHR3_9ZZZZ